VSIDDTIFHLKSHSSTLQACLSFVRLVTVIPLSLKRIVIMFVTHLVINVTTSITPCQLVSRVPYPLYETTL